VVVGEDVEDVVQHGERPAHLVGDAVEQLLSPPIELGVPGDVVQNVDVER
jgi:hypothetical protein